MLITLAPDRKALGRAAARQIAALLRRALAQQEDANLLLSTGMSQFETLEALIAQPVDWRRVNMFHLDEYVGLPMSHKASFRKYLKERFVDLVPIKHAYLINGEQPEAALQALNTQLAHAAMDVGVIGIGENAHIAFNDPPADFARTDAYHIVTLDDACKRQQVGEGWFAAVEDVPARAISITPRRIMACRHIVSPVPDLRKAKAIQATLNAKGDDPMVPASLLKNHPSWHLFVDTGSFSLCAPGLTLPFGELV